MTIRSAGVDGDEPYDTDYDELYRDTAGSGGPPWGSTAPSRRRSTDGGVDRLIQNPRTNSRAAAADDGTVTRLVPAANGVLLTWPLGQRS